MTTKTPTTGAATQFVTPELAEEWLLHNQTRNRSIQQRRVEAYADDMKAGRWMPNASMLAFNTDGFLIDGYHRLMAIILSGTTQEFVIASVDHEAQKVIDTGRPRSAGNQLAVLGFTNTNITAATACILLSYPKVSGTYGHSTAAIVGLCESSRLLQEAVSIYTHTSRPNKWPSYAFPAATHVIVPPAIRDEVERFWKNITTFENLSERGGAGKAYVQWLTRAASAKQSWSTAARWRAWVMALNAYLTETDTPRMLVREQGSFVRFVAESRRFAGGDNE